MTEPARCGTVSEPRLPFFFRIFPPAFHVDVDADMDMDMDTCVLFA